MFSYSSIRLISFFWLSTNPVGYLIGTQWQDTVTRYTIHDAGFLTRIQGAKKTLEEKNREKNRDRDRDRDHKSWHRTIPYHTISYHVT